MIARLHCAPVYLRLKARARAVIKQAGGQESAASITRPNHQTLSRYGSPNDPTQMPIDVVADLESDIGDPVITRSLADIAGYLLVAKPEAGNDDPKWMEQLAALAKEAGEAMAKLAGALADGKISADEVRTLNLRRELREVAEVVATLDAMLARLETEAAPNGRMP